MNNLEIKRAEILKHNINKKKILLKKLHDRRADGILELSSSRLTAKLQNYFKGAKKWQVLVPGGVKFFTSFDGFQVWFYFLGPRGAVKAPLYTLNFLGVDKGSDGVLFLKVQKLLVASFSSFQNEIIFLSKLIWGVIKGFKKILNMHGVGYKASILDKNNVVSLSVGLNKDIYFQTYRTTSVFMGQAAKSKKLFLFGSNEPEISGQAAQIHAFRKPDSYKGKGIRYQGAFSGKKITKERK